MSDTINVDEFQCIYVTVEEFNKLADIINKAHLKDGHRLTLYQNGDLIGVSIPISYPLSNGTYSEVNIDVSTVLPTVSRHS